MGEAKAKKLAAATAGAPTAPDVLRSQESGTAVGNIAKEVVEGLK